MRTGISSCTKMAYTHGDPRWWSVLLRARALSTKLSALVAKEVKAGCQSLDREPAPPYSGLHTTQSLRLINLSSANAKNQPRIREPCINEGLDPAK